MKAAHKFWMALGVLVLLSPLGLLLPAYFKASEPLGLEGSSAPQNWKQYLLTAALGGAVVALVMVLIGKFLAKKDD